MFVCDERAALMLFGGSNSKRGGGILGAIRSKHSRPLAPKEKEKNNENAGLHAFFDETTSDREFFPSENISTIEDRSILYQTLSLPKNTCSLFYSLDSCSICDTK